MATITSVADTSSLVRPDIFRVGVSCGFDSAIQRNSLARSLALCQRPTGSLTKHFRIARSSAGDTDCCTVDTGGISPFSTAAITPARLVPSKAFRPVTIS